MKNNTQPFKALLRHIHANWIGVLSPAEYRLLMFIFDRTIMFGKLREAIPIRHFIQGITAADGTVIVDGLQENERTVYRLLAHLQSIAIIHVYRNAGHVSEYEINFALTKEQLLNTVNRVKKGEKSAKQPLTKMSPHPCQKCHPPISTPTGCLTEDFKGLEKFKNFPNGRAYARARDEKSARGNDMASKAALEAMAKLRGIESEKKDNGRKKRKQGRTAKSYWKVWEAAFRKYHPLPEMAAWTIGDGAGVVRLMKPLRIEHDELITYSVRYWTRIMNEHFATYKSRPNFPNVRFFIQHFALFLDSFAMHSADGRLQITATVDPEVEKLRRQLAEAQRKLSEKDEQLKLERKTSAAKLGQQAIRHKQQVEELKRLQKASDKPKTFFGTQIPDWDD